MALTSDCQFSSFAVNSQTCLISHTLYVWGITSITQQGHHYGRKIEVQRNSDLLKSHSRKGTQQIINFNLGLFLLSRASSDLLASPAERKGAELKSRPMPVKGRLSFQELNSTFGESGNGYQGRRKVPGGPEV